MWILNDTVIGNTDDVDYTMEEWENVFASIKVDVAGDFDEKNIATDEACFTTGITKTYQLNNNITTDELNKCTTYVTGWNWLDGETPEAFCKGTGTHFEETFQIYLDNSTYLANEDLTYFETNNIIKSTATYHVITGYDISCGNDVIIPNTINNYPVEIIGGSDTNIVEQLSNTSNAKKFNNLNNFKSDYKVKLLTVGAKNGAFESLGITSVVIPSSVIRIDENAFSFNNLTNIVIPNNVITIGFAAFKNNQLTSIDIPNSVTKIGQSAFENNQLTSVTIPTSVTTIGQIAFNNNKLPDNQAFIYKRTDANNDKIAEVDDTTIISYGGINKQIVIPNNITTIGQYAFENNQLTSVVISNSVTIIGDYAFKNNQLTSIDIPNSVSIIGEYAFETNQLVNIAIGNGIKYIDRAAFEKTSLYNSNLSKMTINKSCVDIKKIQASSTNNNKYYPWLYYRSPYTATGVTIYGSNNEICDSF